MRGDGGDAALAVALRRSSSLTGRVLRPFPRKPRAYVSSMTRNYFVVKAKDATALKRRATSTTNSTILDLSRRGGFVTRYESLKRARCRTTWTRCGASPKATRQNFRPSISDFRYGRPCPERAAPVQGARLRALPESSAFRGPDLCLKRRASSPRATRRILMDD
ncbi:hypothetical protein BD626DRAFT_280420 [Schizophyllum amplum]|uniref:Uncharacterized protein n=1 Tax=Schizophyllum amplum TaxID=97359 RepID=A0A550BT98_9AGAR|nr:hypothetical protein BD626DRAFT_280420 [Auriculariopsis ampla]